jgi:signal transduction histidine kinase
MSTTANLTPDECAASAPGPGTDSACSHTVQFYEQDSVLLDRLVKFVGSSLGAGGAALVVATGAHQDRLLERLEHSGLDVLQAAETGRFVCLDAADTLSRFMVDGWPDAERFQRVVGSALQPLRSVVSGGAISAFGEMVAVLLSQGKTDAAIRLEQLWNELIEAYPCHLLCAYPVGSFSHTGCAKALQQICAEHTHLVHDEASISLGSEEERLRAVLALRDKTDALQRVIEERERLNAAQAGEIEDLRALHELANRLSWLDLPQFLREVVSAVVALHKTDIGLVSLVQPERKTLEVAASVGLSEEFLKSIRQVSMGAGACGACMQRGESVLVENTESDPLFEAYRDAARGEGFRAVYSTPLMDRGKNLVGVLTVQFREPHRPSEREIRLTELYARLTGSAIETSRLSFALMQAEKTAATGRLAATIAHEINNPLEAVVNLLYILRSSIGDNPEAQRYLHLADSELGRVAQITKQTLSFYRERQSPEMVDIRELISSVLHVFSKRLSERHINVTRHEQPCSIVGLKGELRQLFSNLIDNAIAAVSDQGKIEISVVPDGDSVAVSIADNGHGIPDEHQPRLFDAFYTTKQHNGTGLGLWVAKEIVQKHHGEITAESSTDPVRHGTTFRVRIAGLRSEDRRPASTLRAA